MLQRGALVRIDSGGNTRDALFGCTRQRVGRRRCPPLDTPPGVSMSGVCDGQAGSKRTSGGQGDRAMNLFGGRCSGRGCATEAFSSEDGSQTSHSCGVALGRSFGTDESVRSVWLESCDGRAGTVRGNPGRRSADGSQRRKTMKRRRLLKARESCTTRSGERTLRTIRTERRDFFGNAAHVRWKHRADRTRVKCRCADWTPRNRWWSVDARTVEPETERPGDASETKCNHPVL